MTEYAYDAFLSYSHSDKPAASRIQRYLESYRFPDARRRLKICFDDTDIRAGPLSAELEGMLARSRCLVVCCSPAVPESEWVRREIETFQTQDAGRPIVLLLIGGESESAIPESLAADDRQFPDLRNGWVLGWMKPRAQDAIVSAIATIADGDPREIARWDRRWRRRRRLRASGALGMAAILALVFPFDGTFAVPLPSDATSIGVVEYCDVSDGELQLLSRERVADRNYVKLFNNVLGPPPPANAWVNETGYVPSRRLLYVGALDRAVEVRAREALDLAALRRRARHVAADLEAEHERWTGGTIELFRDSLFLAEPSPGTFIGLYGIAPIPGEPADAGIVGPPDGQSVVAVASPVAGFQIAVVDRLFPPGASEPPTPRSLNVNDGLPVAALGGDIWIGMPARPDDGGLGGLWRSSDGGRRWESIDISGSVGSLLPDTVTGRLLLATRAGPWSAGGRRGVYEAALLAFDTREQRWVGLDGPPFSSDAVVQLCGHLEDGSLLVRVEQDVFRMGPTNLFRRWRNRSNGR